MNADGFLTLVQRYGADFIELTPEMRKEFIPTDKKQIKKVTT